MLWIAGVGSRKTPPPFLRVIEKLAYDISNRGTGIRSGNAFGADQAFEKGGRAGASRVVSYLATPKPGVDGIALSQIHASIAAQACEIAKAHHPAWSRLDAYAQKLMTRNVLQVLGSTLDEPVIGVACWASGSVLDGGRVASVAGGTGLAVRIAHNRGIPVLNLALPCHLERARRWHHSPDLPTEHLFH